MRAGDSIAIPAGKPHALHGWSPDLELLEVTAPAVVHWKRVSAVAPSASASDAQNAQQEKEKEKQKQTSLSHGHTSRKSQKSKL